MEPSVNGSSSKSLPAEEEVEHMEADSGLIVGSNSAGFTIGQEQELEDFFTLSKTLPPSMESCLETFDRDR